MSHPPADQAVQELLDHYAIETVLKRYASALDTYNYDALDQCFVADAFVDYTEAGGIKGNYPQVKAWLAQVLASIVQMQHFVANVEVSLDGDSASVSSYTLNVNGLTDAAGAVSHMVVGAIYNDRFVRTAQGWRISNRSERRLCTMGQTFGPAGD